LGNCIFLPKSDPLTGTLEAFAVDGLDDDTGRIAILECQFAAFACTFRPCASAAESGEARQRAALSPGSHNSRLRADRRHSTGMRCSKSSGLSSVRAAVALRQHVSRY
jgi:hypothetical protein